MSWARGRGKSRRGADIDCVSVPSATPGGATGGMSPGGAKGGMGPAQSSKTGPSDTTTSAGVVDLVRLVSRLQKQLFDELQQPAAKLTVTKLKETNRMKDIGISSVHYYEDMFARR